MSIDALTKPESHSPAPTQTNPQSRAQSRKQKRLSSHAPNNEIAIRRLDPKHSPSWGPAETSTSTSITTIPRPLSQAPQATMPPSSRLLIASIGNPAPYTSTLHSAGHTVLYALSSALRLPLQKSNREWAHGLLAPAPDQGDDPQWTLWASPVNMNISGRAVASAWRAFASQTPSRTGHGGDEARLVVLHDELEAPLGSVRVRPGSLSPKGHNGLKSIREKMPDVQYTRIGIGIGRPEGRDPATVAGYVLRKMTAQERGKIEGAVGGVLGELKKLSGG